MKKLLCLLTLLLLLAGCGKAAATPLDTDNLTPVTSELPVPPEGIRMELVKADSNNAVIRYVNETGWAWEYGFHYWLHTRIDGQWYGMPQRTDTDVEYAFIDMGYILNPGESREWTCEFRDWMYGVLPAGHYRIVTDYGWVEFDTETQPKTAGISALETTDLMPGAEATVFEIWRYDGDRVRNRVLRQPETEEILGVLRQESWETVEADPSNLGLPIYSFRGCADGNAPVGGIWADGVFFREDGQAFAVDLDFSSWFSDGRDGEKSLLPAMPCIHLFAKPSDRWNTAFLYADDLKPAPARMVMQLESWTENLLTLKISNGSKADWVYYGGAYIEVCLDDCWYRIPGGGLEWWVEAEVVPWTVESGKNGLVSYGLPVQYELPAGQYRIVVDGMTAKFEIQTNGGED